MANPTTNYGWPMPTATDLVTDLPADFAAFGQPVDTSLKALNPETTLGDIAYRSATSNTNTRLGIGTNGQVLAVSSGVPAWTTTADVTPLTTKGDVFTFSTVDARIGVGANNTVLTADSAEATGLKWATPAAGGKVLQVVTANITTDTTISSTTYTDTAMTITISPTLATSRILVLFALQCRISTTANDTVGIGLKLLRDATSIVDMSAGTNSRAFAIQATADGVPTLASTIYTNYNYVDSPATTSATTYKVQAAINSTAASRSARFQMQNIPSVITVLEIGA